AMGLLQRFARPEYRTGREPEASEDVQTDPAPVPEGTEPGTAPLGGPAQDVGSAYGSDAVTQEPVASESLPAAGAAPIAVPAPQPPPAEPERNVAEVIAFANQKGGVAKTTTTLNLAVAFAETGHRVLAVDMDPQGNLTMSQGIDPDSVEKSMYDVLVNDLPISEVIHHRHITITMP